MTDVSILSGYSAGMRGYAQTLKRVMEADYAGASEEEKLEAVRDLITVCSVGSAAVAWQPVPFVDIALLTPIQIGVCQGIGRVYGYTLDKKSVVEILSAFGASLAAQHAILAAASLIPIFGWAVKMSMAYALTYAIGEVSNFYFASGRGVSSDELKDMFKKVYEEKKAEKVSSAKKNDTLKEKLEQLNEAKKSELLTDDEYAKKKEEILASF